MNQMTETRNIDREEMIRLIVDLLRKLKTDRAVYELWVLANNLFNIGK